MRTGRPEESSALVLGKKTDPDIGCVVGSNVGGVGKERKQISTFFPLLFLHHDNQLLHTITGQS